MGSFTVDYGSGRNSSLAQEYSRGVKWSQISSDSVSQSNGFPAKYSTITTCKCTVNFFIRYNYAGEERARAWDSSSSDAQSGSYSMLMSDTISTNTTVSKTIDFLAKGKCKSSVTGVGTGLWNNSYTYFVLECYSQVSQTSGCLRINDVKIICNWTAPKIVVSVAKDSSSTGDGTVSGGGNVNIDYSGKTYTTTITATPKDSNSKFVKWSDGNTSATRTLSFTDSDLTSASTSKKYYAIFEAVETKVNKIYVGTKQPSKIYIGTTEVKEVYVGTTKVYG